MPAPQVSLEVVAGRATGTMIPVEDELMIGRHAEGLGRLADDQEISRLHARVSLDGSGFCAIEDLGSTNGTFVNGLRVSTPQTLTHGDTIELGDTTLVVRRREAEPEGAPADGPPPAEAPPAEAPPAAQAPPAAESAAGFPEGAEPAETPELPVDDVLVPHAAETPAADAFPPTAAYEPGAEPEAVEREAEVVEPEPADPEAPTAPDPFRGAPASAATPQPAPFEPQAVDPPAVAPLAVDVPPEAPASIEAPSEAFPLPLSLRVEVDFAARTTLIRLGDDSPPVRLAYVDGTWRQVPQAD